MIPDLLKLLFTKANIFPSENILQLVEKESSFTILKFVDVLVDLAYFPSEVESDLRREAKELIEKIIDSSIAFEMFKHLFSLQGPPKDKNITTIKGNILIKALPKWKQDAFDCLIRQISSKNGGIRQLMLTVMDMLGNEKTPKVAGEIAKCICRPPNNINSNNELEDHYRQLSKQIIDLLQISNLTKILSVTAEEKNEHSEYLRFSQCVALECIHLCARINKVYAQKYLMDVLFSDFYKILDSGFIDCVDSSEMVVLHAELLMESLILHSSLLDTLAPSLYIQQILQNFSDIYMRIVSVFERNDNRFTIVTNQILLRLIELRHGSSKHYLIFIKSLVELDPPRDKQRLHQDLVIRRTLDGEKVEVAMKDTCLTTKIVGVNPNENFNIVLVNILKNLPILFKDEIVSNLFLWLLECRFTIRESLEENILLNDNDSTLVLSEYRDHLMSLICTEMESHCFTKSVDILKLTKIVISNYAHDVFLIKHNQQNKNDSINENINYALSMLICVLERGKLVAAEQSIFEEIFPTLQRLRFSHPLEKTKDLITDISIVIATHGHVNYLSRDHVIEEVDDNIDRELKEAFIDMASEEVPVKAHGIVVIYTLLKTKNESALRNRNKIFHILSQLLFHSDSFIYLRVISALSIIGDQYTDKMLPMVAQRVRACRGKHSLLPGIKEDSTLEDWMKLNEIFMKIIHNLGYTAPIYRDIILGALLPGLGDEEEIVRASSLSSLAELCSQHDYLLTTVIYEVVNNVCNVLVNDRSSLVKKAAALTIRKLVLGTSDDTPRPEIMQLFPGDILLTIYRSLKAVLNSETDDSILDHVSAAYNSLDDSVKMFVFPQPSTKIEKTIKILDLYK